MEKQYNIEDWSIFLDENGLSPEYKKMVMNQVKQFYKNNVPVILDLEHLSSLLGVKLGVLSSMIYSSKTFYRTFSIPKRRGGKREIVSPRNSLLECQQFITKEILSSFKISDSAFAYRKGLNIMKNAESHIGQDFMLKLDLKDFFGHINISRVRELFTRVGYSKDVSFYLSRLCCLEDKLPQGGGTSPIISNIILKSMDNKLIEIASKNNFIYTRYADDLIISSKTPFNSYIVEDIGGIIKKEGFVINKEKSRVYLANNKKIVTGLYVDKKKIRLTKSKRRNIRQEVYFLKKNGIISQIEIQSDLFAFDRVLGKLFFWKQVEPNNEYVLNSILELKIMKKRLLEG